MRRILLAGLCAGALLLGMIPGSADEGYAHRDVVGMLAQSPNRVVPKAPGTVEDLTLVFGPYVVPAGQDSNRTIADINLPTGFMVAVAPDLVEASTGHIPSEQHAHIHHAHWFRITQDDQYEYYDRSLGLSWVFGTGEEKTQGRLDDRANLEPDGKRYGIYIEGGTPQALIYMIHNKDSVTNTYFVVLDVTFIHGTRDQLAAANPPMDMHPLHGTLWGQTRDATGQYPELRASYTATADGVAVASGGHAHPGGKEVVVTNLGPDGPDAGTEPDCTADTDGDGYPGVTILRSRKYDRIANAWPYSEDYQMGATKFGWRAPIHQGDVLRQFAPYAVAPSASTPFDVAGRHNFGSPDLRPHGHFEAMSYTGIYVDRLQDPGWVNAGNVCDPANFRPWLLGADTFEVQGLSSRFPAEDVRIDDLQARYMTGVTEGMVNHLWIGDADKHCGVVGTGLPGESGAWNSGACEKPADATWTGDRVDMATVHVGGFSYLPGDLSGTTPIPRVPLGTSIQFVNEDAAANIRHSITSCRAPCNGAYVANYPVPDGVFDSGKIGNIDPIDGGAFQDVDFGSFEEAGEIEGLLGVQSLDELLAALLGLLDSDSPNKILTSETVPLWQTPATLPAGLYTYYCRIHPWMRGAFEVTA